MTEEEFEKKLKGTKTFCIIIGILFFIGIFLNLGQEKYINVVLSIILIILLILFYTLTKKRKVAGPIIGIILGSLYILQINIISIVVGIFIIIDSSAMIKYINGK